MLREHRPFIDEYHRNLVAHCSYIAEYADILGDAWNCINSSASLFAVVFAHYIYSESRGKYDARY